MRDRSDGPIAPWVDDLQWSYVSLLAVSKKEEGILTLHLFTEHIKTWHVVGAGTEMWTHYLQDLCPMT